MALYLLVALTASLEMSTHNGRGTVSTPHRIVRHRASTPLARGEKMLLHRAASVAQGCAIIVHREQQRKYPRPFHVCDILRFIVGVGAPSHPIRPPWWCANKCFTYAAVPLRSALPSLYHSVCPAGIISAEAGYIVALSPCHTSSFLSIEAVGLCCTGATRRSEIPPFFTAAAVA